MSLFPSKPVRGHEVLSWARRISDYVLASTPRSSATVKVSRTPNGTTFSSKRVIPYHPFEVYRVPDSAGDIRMFDGSRIVNGREAPLDVDIGEEYATLAMANGTNYVFVALECDAGDRNPFVFPDLLAPDSTQTLSDIRYPNEILTTEFVLIAIVEYDAGAGVITDIDQRVFADIPDQGIIPDSDSVLFGTAPYHQTLEWSPTDDVHKGEVGWYDIASALDQEVPVIYRDVSGNIYLDYHYIVTMDGDPQLDAPASYNFIRSIDDAGASDSYATCNWDYGKHDVEAGRHDIADVGSETSYLDVYVDPVWEVPGNVYKSHHALDVFDLTYETIGSGWGDYDDHEDGPYKYMVLGGKNATDADHYSRNSNNALTGEDNWLGNKLHVETTLYANVDGDYYAILGDDANLLSGYFDGDGRTVEICSDDEALYAEDGTREVYLCDDANALAAYNGAQSLLACDGGNVIAADDGVHTAGLCTGSYALEALAGGMNVAAADAYYIGDVAGVTLANWHTKGIFTNEVGAIQLQLRSFVNGYVGLQDVLVEGVVL